MLRSRGRHREALQTLTAWHAAVTINHNGWMQSSISVDDLLGRSTIIDLTESPDALKRLEELGADDGV